MKSRNKPGRNAPCPCGSGKKYKRCCGADVSASSGSTPADDAAQQLAEAIQASGASTLDEMNELARKIYTQRNERPLDDFLGLSPNQMQAMLYSPLDAPQLVTFDNSWYPEQSIAIDLFKALVAGVGDGGIKATARGNLPIKLCREILGCGEHDELSRLRRIRSEVEFEKLHTVRLVSDLAGLMKRRKNRFYITQRGRQLSLPENRGDLFHALFRTYVSKFNWGYRNGYPAATFIQTAWLFSLYCLSLFGQQWRSSRFYAEQFAQAFPAAIHEMAEGGYFSPEQQFRTCYATRTLERFVLFWGLAEKRTSQPKKPSSYEYELRAPSLSDWLHFHC